MNQLFAKLSVSISELKRSPSALLKQAAGAPIAVLNHNKPAGYLVPASTWESLMDTLDDAELARIVEARRGDKDAAITVNLDEL